MNQVRLVHYSEEHLADLENFILPKEQEQFTTLPADQLIRLTGDQWPVVITADEKAVGFFVLEQSERLNHYTQNESAYLLASLSITKGQQGKGFAKEAMNLLPEWVRQEIPMCDEVVLSVNLKNDAAFRLYLSTGFEDTGRRITGPVGEQRVMSRMIKNERER
ncbi:GNAT family N-acetyltransferase [Jeotgalibacillus terrae]|uniref:GNAT family N-acetyltransferase n=1 Tax=Jeotgalibacillus terrae TaxID=587735 RepID=A0ABW5ZGU8_9BACL|nr:GNAT family N-acetyltransferase [Jeotgalibacillus terrae]MBM7579371.1 RimJ/RimL family protein N-acetyltransferase [Jeotgalibacillus terrae]